MKIGGKVRALREELNTHAHWVYWAQDGDEASYQILGSGTGDMG